MSMKTQPTKRLSCVTCRQRKIKCDRSDPCAPCARAGLRCTTPQPAPQRPRTKPRTKSDQLAQRLSRLEGLISTLGGEEAIKKRAVEKDLPLADSGVISPAIQQAFGQSPAGDAAHVAQSSPERLLVGSDGSRIPASGFWTNLSAEVEGLRSLLLDSEHEELDVAEASSGTSTGGQAHLMSRYLFTHTDIALELETRYPAPEQATTLVDMFFERFDPFFKVLHRPTTLEILEPVLDGHETALSGPDDEALAFAIFYAGLTTMQPSECLSVLNDEKDHLLRHYESSIEAALVNADVLTTTSLATLQAVVIYIMCLHNHHKTRTSWTLVGLAVRIATAMNLNRDGHGLGLSSFESEMRRRLWWGIIVLDMHGCEDRATQLMVHSWSYDTRMPLNINDDDLDPEHGIAPALYGHDNGEDEDGFSEMTFSLILFEVARGFEYVSFADSSYGRDTHVFTPPTYGEKERRVNQINNLIFSRWTQHCDLAVPIEAKTLMMSRISILKLWLLLQYPTVARTQNEVPKPTAVRDQILGSAVSLLEIQHKLELIDDSCWATRNWMEWHALAVTLAELCTKTSGPLIDRAWSILDIMFEPWSDSIKNREADSVWRPIRRLLTKAQRIHNRSNTGTPFGRMAWESVPGGITDVTASPDPSATMLHDTSIAMALNSATYPRARPDLSVQVAPQAFQYYAGPPMDAIPEAVNWEDWGPFVERATGQVAHSAGTSYRSSHEPPR